MRKIIKYTFRTTLILILVVCFAFLLLKDISIACFPAPYGSKHSSLQDIKISIDQSLKQERNKFTGVDDRLKSLISYNIYFSNSIFIDLSIVNASGTVLGRQSNIDAVYDCVSDSGDIMRIRSREGQIATSTAFNEISEDLDRFIKCKEASLSLGKNFVPTPYPNGSIVNIDAAGEICFKAKATKDSYLWAILISSVFVLGLLKLIKEYLRIINKGTAYFLDEDKLNKE